MLRPRQPGHRLVQNENTLCPRLPVMTRRLGQQRFRGSAWSPWPATAAGRLWTMPTAAVGYSCNPRFGARDSDRFRVGTGVALNAGMHLHTNRNQPRKSLQRKCATAMVMAAATPLLLGAQGDGCATSSRSPAPDVSGRWAIDYDDVLDVSINIGGVVYEEQLGAGGGVITIDHQGQPLTFDLDCARPEILCPSEAWPNEVTIEQRDERFEHRMIVTLPSQRCVGELVDPDPAECGPDTNNEACDRVCTGEVVIEEAEAFGVIGESGDTFRLYLGGGIASNGINCALLGFSLADAYLGTEGAPTSADWRAHSMDAGLVTVGYAGGCLWAGDPNLDGELEALLIGASVTFTTGFTGDRL